MTEQFIGKKKLSLSLLIKIVKDTGQGFIDDSVTRLSGSLAYATLFSIIPFLSLLVTIGVALHMDLANQLYIQLEPIVGAEVIGALRLIIENAERTDSSASAAIVSLGISIFGATTIFAEIQSSLNSIWGIKAVPKKSWLKFIKNRILSFSIILVFAFILLITFTITNKRIYNQCIIIISGIFYSYRLFIINNFINKSFCLCLVLNRGSS